MMSLFCINVSLQHVDSELLHPHHTLRNIMFLVSPENKNLGRYEFFAIFSR